MATDIVGLLERVQSPDDVVRNEAEQLLKRMELEDYRGFLISLCATFASEDRPMHIQRLAVIIFKNALDSKEQETKVPRPPSRPNTTPLVGTFVP